MRYKIELKQKRSNYEEYDDYRMEQIQKELKKKQIEKNRKEKEKHYEYY